MVTRKEFFQKLEPFHAPSTLRSIELAYTLAKFGHRAQVRKEMDSSGQPVRYFEHVKRVALVLIDEASFYDATTIISALLHDGIEDTRDLTPDMIEHAFGQDVVKIVKSVSKVPKEGYLQRLEASTDFRSYFVKLADRIDNVRSLGAASLAFQEKQLKETVEHYLPLFSGRMFHVVPDLYVPHATTLLQLLNNAVAAYDPLTSS